MKRAVWVAGGATVAVLVAGGLLTEVGPWYASLRKPKLQPPDWAFAPAWTTIGALTAAASVCAWNAADTPAERRGVLALFGINGVCNILWSALFFKLRRPDWALIETPALFASVAAAMLAFRRRAPLASILLAPYLLWVGFAWWLNGRIVRLNRPFSAS